MWQQSNRLNVVRLCCFGREGQCRKKRSFMRRVGLECPRIYSTDLDDLRLLAEWH
jgi:hypothetical protein